MSWLVKMGIYMTQDMDDQLQIRTSNKKKKKKKLTVLLLAHLDKRINLWFKKVPRRSLDDVKVFFNREVGKN